MKKRIVTLICIILSSVAMAQNKDSLELERYFKQGQKNFKYIKAMDSLNTIVISLQEEIYKDREKNFKYIKAMDSLNTIVISLQEKTKYKEREIKSYEHAVENVKDNLKLYSFLLKIEKETLKNLENDTSEYIKMEDGLIKLILKDDVNLETLAILVGKNELEKQLPKVNSYIKNNIIKVVLPPIYAYAMAPPPPPPPPAPSPPPPPAPSPAPSPPPTGMSGYSLPDWPINTNISLQKDQLDIIYSKQENYIIKFCMKYECGSKLLKYYREKQNGCKIPQQLQQLIINQILFKNYLDKICQL